MYFETRRPDFPHVNLNAESRADPRGGGDWGDRPSKTYESKFIRHDFVQFGKQNSWFKAICR